MFTTNLPKTASVVDVWYSLGGPELKKARNGCYRAPAFWRNSKDRNIWLDADRNIYYDHVNGRGGSPASLVMQVRECSSAEAGRWLREQFGPLDSGQINLHKRRDAEEERAAAQGIAIALRWHIENELEIAKLAAWRFCSEDGLPKAPRVRDLTRQLESIDTWTPSEAVSRLRQMNPKFIAHLYNTYREFEIDLVYAVRGGRS